MKVLRHLYDASLEHRYCPKHFKESITVALQKSGKGNYTQSKSYRPIALLNTLDKMMKSIIAERISFQVKTVRGTLLRNHLRGRKLRATENAVHLILEYIHCNFECKYRVVTVISLDVSGAFDNVAKRWLLHNLRKRLGTSSIIE